MENNKKINLQTISLFSFSLKFAKFLYKWTTLKKVTTEKERKIFEKLWYKVWIEEGYAQPNEPIIEKKRKYEKFSKDFLIKFLNIPIGTIRIIYQNDEMKFPILDVFEVSKKLDDEKIVELSLYSILRKYRFFHSTNLIAMKRIYQLLKKEKIIGFLAALDHRLFFFLKEKLKFPLIQIGKEKIYEGSLTFPVYFRLKDGERFLRENNYQLYKFFLNF